MSNLSAHKTEISAADISGREDDQRNPQRHAQASFGRGQNLGCELMGLSNRS